MPAQSELFICMSRWAIAPVSQRTHEPLGDSPGSHPVPNKEKRQWPTNL